MIITGRRVVLREEVRPATLHLHDGKIAAVLERHTAATNRGDIDAGNDVVLPGLVDSHVHINEPGRTEWEGFASATRAAAAGGVTTLVDMPLNSVPATTSVAALDAKRRAAGGQCFVDVAFWGGVVPGNTAELEPLARAGVRGFKCFLAPSGVAEFEHVTESDLRQAMPVIARLGLPLLVHAELPSALASASGDPREYRTWLESRPPAAEFEAIALMTHLAAEFATRVHIVHLATGTALPLLRDARSRGLAVTVETCPHYLSFAAEEIAAGDTRFKCAPPIRRREDQETLWRALRDGEIDLIATDHSPAPAALKHIDDGDFVAAWGGIASLQLGLAAVWTAARGRGVDPAMVARWMCHAPARLAGLAAHKGELREGADADVVIWNPDVEVDVDASRLYHRHPVSPYDGRRLRGRVVTTMVRGTVVYDAGAVIADPVGMLL